jgi:aspartate/methionine/tyrosine aminotransferase
LSQIAATAALSSAARAELNGHVATYRQNRDVLIAALGEGGVQRMAPADGAFYLYADVSGHCDQSSDLAQRLLDDTGVATTPGWDFDPDGGGAWLRLSYAGSSDTIRAAAKLLTPWLAHQKRF